MPVFVLLITSIRLNVHICNPSVFSMHARIYRIRDERLQIVLQIICETIVIL